MTIKKCTDCDCVSDNDLVPSDGKCSEGHGTGCEQDGAEAFKWAKPKLF